MFFRKPIIILSIVVLLLAVVVILSIGIWGNGLMDSEGTSSNTPVGSEGTSSSTPVGSEGTSSNTPVGSSAPSDPIKVIIKFEEPPVPGKPAVLTADYSRNYKSEPQYVYGRPPVEINYKIEIPEGIELVSGEVEHTDFLGKEETQRLNVTITIVKHGVWKLRASAIAANALEGGNTEGSAAVIWIVSDETGITVSDKAP